MNPFKQSQKAELPSYILTETRIPAEQEGDRLLGRIVADFRNPSDNYRPEDPRPALKLGPKVLEIIDNEFSSLFSIDQNKVAQTKVGQILKVDFNKLEKEESSLKSSFVRTRFLTQHRDAFRALVKMHGPEITQLLRDNKSNKRKGYMVVGYKSCVDGQLGKTRQYSDGKSVDFNLPIGAAISAAAIPAATQTDVGFTLGTTGGKSSSAAATMVGEQIFAIRYCVVTLKGEGQYFGDVQRVSREHGVFGETDEYEEVETEDFLMEDDVSDDGEVEVFGGEELHLCGDAGIEADAVMVIRSNEDGD
jgi:hypothetical protein